MKKIITILSISIFPIVLIVFSVYFTYIGIVGCSWRWIFGLSLPFLVYALYIRLTCSNALEVYPDSLHIKNLLFKRKIIIPYHEMKYWKDGVEFWARDHSIIITLKDEKEVVQLIRRTDPANFDAFCELLYRDFADIQHVEDVKWIKFKKRKFK